MGRMKDITKKYERERQQLTEDFMSEMLNKWETSEQQARANIERLDNNEQRRREALRILEKIENKYIAKENKKRLLDNLNLLYDKEMLRSFFLDKIVKFMGINYHEGIVSAEKALNEFNNSIKEYGNSEKLKDFWFEIFYLIEEGIPYTDDNYAYIKTIINNEIGLNFFERDKEMETMEGFLRRNYSSFDEPPYWGTQFYIDFNERRVKEKIEYLRSTLFFPEDEDDYSGPVPDYLNGIKFDILSNFVKEDNTVKECDSSPAQEIDLDLDTKVNENEELKKSKVVEDPIESEEDNEDEEISLNLKNLFDKAKKLKENTDSAFSNITGKIDEAFAAFTETTDNVVNNIGNETKKKIKKGLKGWLNKLSDKLDD